MAFVVGENQLNEIEDTLQKDIIDLGVKCVVLIDMAGNILATRDDGARKHDIYSLAALAAGNFGAVSAMAKIIGEDEFSLLFHKGKSENIHFSKVMDEFLLVTIFSNEVSLGFLRLKVSEAVAKISAVLSASSES